jgi:hypothetical protein
LYITCRLSEILKYKTHQYIFIETLYPNTVYIFVYVPNTICYSAIRQGHWGTYNQIGLGAIYMYYRISISIQLIEITIYRITDAMSGK